MAKNIQDVPEYKLRIPDGSEQEDTIPTVTLPEDMKPVSPEPTEPITPDMNVDSSQAPKTAFSSELPAPSDSEVQKLNGSDAVIKMLNSPNAAPYLAAIQQEEDSKQVPTWKKVLQGIGGALSNFKPAPVRTVGGGMIDGHYVPGAIVGGSLTDNLIAAASTGVQGLVNQQQAEAALQQRANTGKQLLQAATRQDNATAYEKALQNELKNKGFNTDYGKTQLSTDSNQKIAQDKNVVDLTKNLNDNQTNRYRTDSTNQTSKENTAANNQTSIERAKLALEGQQERSPTSSKNAQVKAQKKSSLIMLKNATDTIERAFKGIDNSYFGGGLASMATRGLSKVGLGVENANSFNAIKQALAPAILEVVNQMGGGRMSDARLKFDKDSIIDVNVSKAQNIRNIAARLEGMVDAVNENKEVAKDNQSAIEYVKQKIQELKSYANHLEPIDKSVIPQSNTTATTQSKAQDPFTGVKLE